MPKQSSDAAPHIPAILLTRPAAASERFARALAERFANRVEVILSPLMQTEFHRPALPPLAFDGVIFTSAAAVEGALQLAPPGTALPSRAFCVGDMTARAASNAGFDAHSSGGDAKALLELIMTTGPTGPLLYLHGRDTRGDLAERLNSAGIVTHDLLVYQQDPLPLTAHALHRVAQPAPVLVPIFSPRSADLLRALLPAITAPLYLAAMSKAVAAHAGLIPHRAMHIAARPDAGAMLDTLEELLILAQAS